MPIKITVLLFYALILFNPIKLFYQDYFACKRGGSMKIGTIISERYKIIKKIGSGGTSDVYLVKHLSLNQNMAMKIIAHNRQLNDAYAVIESLKALKHKQLPRIIDVIQDDEYIYIIRDYIAGQSLDEYIATHGALPIDKVYQNGLSLLNVLAYLHTQAKPIIYRDLKPSNIIINDKEELFLIDFGTSRRYKPSNAMDTISLGTKGYAAPEQYGGLQSDARTDYYALGATLYYMYTAEHYCDAQHNKRFQHFQSARAKELKAIINKAMAPIMSERYQTADEFIKALSAKNLPATEVIAIETRKVPMRANKITIGVLASSSGIGATTLALMLAKITQMQIGKTVYCNKSNDNSLTYLENFVESIDYSENLAGNDFKYAGIHFLKRTDDRAIDQLFAANNTSLISDYGANKYLFKDFLRNQYKFVILPAQAWALKDIDFIKQLKDYEDIIFVFNLASLSKMKQLSAWLGIKSQRSFALDYVENPLELSPTHQELKGYLGMGKKPSFWQKLGVVK